MGQSAGAGLPLKKLLPPLLPLIGGKGGGNEQRWQGAGTCGGGAAAFLRALETGIRDAWGE